MNHPNDERTMPDRLVDRLARSLAARGTRRGALSAVAAALLGGAAVAVAGIADGTVAEAATCRPASMGCTHWSHCCSLRCNHGTCSNRLNAEAKDRRQPTQRRRRQDRRHDQRVRRKHHNRAQRRSSQSANSSAKAFTGNVELTVVNSAGRTVWFDLWQADGTGRELALDTRVAGMLGGGQKSRKVQVEGGRAAATLRTTNAIGVSDWVVEVRRSEDGSNVSLATGTLESSEFDTGKVTVSRWDTRKAELDGSSYALDIPEDQATVTVLKMLDDGETVELTIEVADSL
ncbi:MAG: hypothetical protein ACR2J8_08090 [Thermomicrobiales bacterium]